MLNKVGSVLKVTGSLGFNTMINSASVGVGLGLTAWGLSIVAKDGGKIVRDIQEAGTKIVEIVKAVKETA